MLTTELLFLITSYFSRSRTRNQKYDCKRFPLLTYRSCSLLKFAHIKIIIIILKAMRLQLKMKAVTYILGSWDTNIQQRYVQCIYSTED